jgi:transposase
LGNPTEFALSPGQAHDLEGTDALLPGLAADALIADKAFDAEERVLKPLAETGKVAVIPPKGNRKAPRLYDEDLYKARHLIENFFARLKQFRVMPRAITSAPCTSSARSISRPASSGSVEDRP